MNRIIAVPLFFWALSLAPPTARAVSIDTVAVGNAGNANDPFFNHGSVGNAYRIGTYEVTNSQYVEFLNAKDATGTNSLGLYSSSMTSDARGGVDFTSGNANGLKYSVKSGRDNNPVVFVNWYDSIRFANWLNNGQGSGSTETGAYTLLGGTPVPSNGATISRNAGATWFLPSLNEWYKAAYYQPAAQGGDSDNYWLSPTKTNGFPYSDQPPGSDAPTQANTGNFRQHDGMANGYDDGYAVTGSPTFVVSQNYLTNVGAYTQSKSFYGTFDQGGNAWEWDEEPYPGSGSYREARGGSWDTFTAYAQANVFLNPLASDEYYDTGLRVATVPEPKALALAALGGVGLIACAWGRRKR